MVGVSSLANFGRLLASGALTVDPGATLFTNPTSYTPTIFDRYTIVDCGSDDCVEFPNFLTDLGLTQQVLSGDLVLALPTVLPTFINDSFGARVERSGQLEHRDRADQWMPHSSPTGAARGSIRERAVALDRVTVEGDLFVDDALTVALTRRPRRWHRLGRTGIDRCGQWAHRSRRRDLRALDAEPRRWDLGRRFGTRRSTAGTITTNGIVTLDDPVRVNSGSTSVLDVQTGTLDVQSHELRSPGRDAGRR